VVLVGEKQSQTKPIDGLRPEIRGVDGTGGIEYCTDHVKIGQNRTNKYGEIENEKTRVLDGGEYCANSRCEFIGSSR